VSITDALAQTTTRHVDAAGRLLRLIDPLGRGVTYATCRRGRTGLPLGVQLLHDVIREVQRDSHASRMEHGTVPGQFRTLPADPAATIAGRCDAVTRSNGVPAEEPVHGDQPDGSNWHNEHGFRRI
jgi:uncharacterized protein RhaS with RHS repeats